MICRSNRQLSGCIFVYGIKPQQWQAVGPQTLRCAPLTALRNTHIMPRPSMLCSHRTSTTPIAHANRYQNSLRAVRLRQRQRRNAAVEYTGQGWWIAAAVAVSGWRPGAFISGLSALAGAPEV